MARVDLDWLLEELDFVQMYCRDDHDKHVVGGIIETLKDADKESDWWLT